MVLLRKIHGLIVVLWFVAVYLLFFTKFKLIGAGYLILVGLSNLPLSMCPLTLSEQRIIRSNGENEKITNSKPRLFKKYLGFEISYKVARFFIL